MYEMEEWYAQSNKKFAWWELLFRVFLGFVAITLPVLLVVVYIFFLKNQSAIIQFIIGTGVGLSILPILLFITKSDGWHKKWWTWLVLTITIIAMIAVIVII